MFVIVVMICVIVGAMIWQSNKNSELDGTFQRVAHRRNGSYVTGGLFGRPSVRLSHGSVRVLLDVYSSGGRSPTYYTQLHLGWPDAHLRMEVFPEGVFASLGKLLGTQDIEIGSPSFDADYIIRGNDEERIAEVLSKTAQKKIDRLRKLLGNNDIYIGTKAGTLLIKKKSLIDTESSLNKFIDLGLDLYDEFAKAATAGIDFVNEQESSFSLDTSSAVCQICGEPISSDIVYCRSCKTPHHQDCWVYYGKCSTYGCGETRYSTSRRGIGRLSRH